MNKIRITVEHMEDDYILSQNIGTVDITDKKILDVYLEARDILIRGISNNVTEYLTK